MHAQRRDQIVQPLRFGSGRQALDLARARRFERHAGAQVPVPDADVRAGDGKRETLLAHAQRLFGAPARVDVADRPGHAQRHAAGVAHAQAARAHPAVLAVGVAHPILELVQRRLARHVRFDRREPGRDVVGVHLHLRVPLPRVMSSRARAAARTARARAATRRSRRCRAPSPRCRRRNRPPRARNARANPSATRARRRAGATGAPEPPAAAPPAGRARACAARCRSPERAIRQARSERRARRRRPADSRARPAPRRSARRRRRDCAGARVRHRRRRAPRASHRSPGTACRASLPPAGSERARARCGAARSPSFRG